MTSRTRTSCSLSAGLMLLLVLAAACLQASAAVAADIPTSSSARRALREGTAAAQANVREWADKLDNSYLSNAELGLWMKEYEKRCAPLARRFSIGDSAVDKQPLWVLEISDTPGVQEPEPNFKYVANMHGDETSGRALLPLLAEWLCENYQKDERATRIVRDMHFFIMPTMNPDGFTRRQRNNGQWVDLNRNFPDPQKSCQPSLAGCLPVSLIRGLNSAPEAWAVARWSLAANSRTLLRRNDSGSISAATPPRNVRRFHFTAAANLHEGAVVANYPFDGSPVTRASIASAAATAPIASITSGVMDAVTAAAAATPQQQQPSDVGQALELQGAREDSSIPRNTVTPPAAEAAAMSDGSSSSSSSSSVQPAGYHAAPDDPTFRFLAKTYAEAHTWMSDNAQNSEFRGGITNGAAWYDVYGGMQDWDYLAGACMDITLELNNAKYPPANELRKIWNENKEALLALPLTAALGGIRGNVTSSSDGLPVPATITVVGISWRTFADSYFGFYARPIRPGVYTVRATYPGFRAATAKVTVPEDLSGVVQNLVLRPVR